MTFEAAACSAKGIRELNEDSFIIASVINKIAGVYTEESISGNDEKLTFFAVADGMGGQGSGEKASNLVVSRLKAVAETKTAITENELKEEIESIHKLIIETGSQMGSTLSGIIFQKGRCAVVNLGDSRTYRLRGDMFLKMTNDDSLKRYDSAAASNIITNGIGGGLTSISVNCRFSDKIVMPGDVFLMCSDGIHGFVSDEEIEDALKTPVPVKEIAANIVQKAISNHTDDNCTAVILKIKE